MIVLWIGRGQPTATPVRALAGTGVHPEGRATVRGVSRAASSEGPMWNRFSAPALAQHLVP